MNLLASCSWDKEYIEKFPRIKDHYPKERICLTDGWNPSVFFNFAYYNPNENIKALTVESTTPRDQTGHFFTVPDIGCPHCNQLSVEIEFYTTEPDGIWQFDAWLIDMNGAPSEVYTFELYVGSCFEEEG